MPKNEKLSLEKKFENIFGISQWIIEKNQNGLLDFLGLRKEKNYLLHIIVKILLLIIFFSLFFIIIFISDNAMAVLLYLSFPILITANDEIFYKKFKYTNFEYRKEKKFLVEIRNMLNIIFSNEFLIQELTKISKFEMFKKELDDLNVKINLFVEVHNPSFLSSYKFEPVSITVSILIFFIDLIIKSIKNSLTEYWFVYLYMLIIYFCIYRSYYIGKKDQFLSLYLIKIQEKLGANIKSVCIYLQENERRIYQYLN